MTHPHNHALNIRTRKTRRRRLMRALDRLTESRALALVELAHASTSWPSNALKSRAISAVGELDAAVDELLTSLYDYQPRLRRP